MSRQATGVDIDALPRKAVKPEMADRTYQKYKKRLETAYLEILHAQQTGDEEHEVLWQKALDALVARLEEVGRYVPTLDEIQTGRTPTTRLNVRSAQAALKVGKAAESSLDVAINLIKSEDPTAGAEILKQKLAELNKKDRDEQSTAPKLEIEKAS